MGFFSATAESWQYLKDITAFSSFLCVRIERDLTALGGPRGRVNKAALNRSSSHCCGFELSSSHVRQAKFCMRVVRWGSPVFATPNE